ncbi:MAG: hypothetical protein JSW59_19920 [Phycisphaerales bacterium]|nr:MAG: hypothetical protein JSW59_19920 [Phycisphaerales bacterium]
MSVLSVNLKHLYQRRSLWLVYLVLGLLAFSFRGTLARSSAEKGHFIVPVALEFLIGVYTASMPIQILTKPFSYCLPGHRAVPRKFIFWVGLVTSLLGPLVIPGYSRLWSQRVLATCSICCAGLIMYLIGAALVFGVMNSGPILGLLVWLFFGSLFFDLHIVAERAILDHPFAIIFLGLASSAAVWIWLGNSNWARRFCAVSRFGWLDVWDQNKIRQYARKQAAAKWDKLKNHPEPWVERFFLDRMNRCEHLGPGRYIWGGLYTTFGMTLSWWKGILSGWLAALAFALCLSYLGPQGRNILFLMVGGMVANWRLPVYSSMAIPGGGNERFSTSIILAGSMTVLVTAAVAILVAVSVGLAPIMPEITFRGMVLTFHAVSSILLLVPSIILPIALAFRLIIFRNPFSAFASITAMTLLMLGFGIISSGRLGTLTNPTSLTSLLILGWLAFVLVLRHVCMRRSLVGQARTY